MMAHNPINNNHNMAPMQAPMPPSPVPSGVSMPSYNTSSANAKKETSNNALGFAMPMSDFKFDQPFSLEEVCVAALFNKNNTTYLMGKRGGQFHIRRGSWLK